MIHLDRLTAADKGRKVGYQKAKNEVVQEGTLQSWNEHFVFVRYDEHINWGAIPTPPEKLEFL